MVRRYSDLEPKILLSYLTVRKKLPHIVAPITEIIEWVEYTMVGADPLGFRNRLADFES